VYHRLGDSLAQWQQLLIEIKKARSTFDTSEKMRMMGKCCVVEYEQVQSRVNAKYDMWQRELMSRFGNKLGGVMRETYGLVMKARNELENQSIEGLVNVSSRRF